MSRTVAAVSLLLFGLGGFAPPVEAQCWGSALAATGSTSKPKGYCNPLSPDLQGALQWTLSVSCLNECGQVWMTLPPQYGAADAARSVVPPEYCFPEWYRYNYTNGLYAESSAWNMRVWFGCATDYQSIASLNCPCAPSCVPHDPRPTPQPCSGTPGSETLALGVEGTIAAGLDRLPSGFFSNRREKVDGVEYVMEDWAVLRTACGWAEAVGLSPVVASSVARLAPRSDGLGSGGVRFAARGGWLTPDRSRSIAVVVEAPVHPDNSRMIPVPTVELLPAALPYLGERITAAIRIDLGEDREIRDVQLLDATGILPGGIDLAEHLRKNLRLRYGSEKKHRVIVYGLLDLDAGRVRLQDSLVVTPLCCCNPICV